MKIKDPVLDLCCAIIDGCLFFWAFLGSGSKISCLLKKKKRDCVLNSRNIFLSEVSVL